MRTLEPYFPAHMALFIIWAEDRWERRSLAAGGITAMHAAWSTLQDECPMGTLTLQDGGRVILKRGPLR